MISAVICMSLRRVWHLCNLPCVKAHFYCKIFFKSPSICFLREKYDALVSLPWTFCLLAFYIATPGPAVTRTVCKHSTCSFLSRISYLPSCGFLKRRPSFTSRNTLVYRNSYVSCSYGPAYVSAGAWRIGLFLLWSFWHHRIQNVAIYPQVCWLFVRPSSKNLPLHATQLKITP